MKNNSLRFCFLLFSSFVFSQNLPKVSSGTIERMENFQSNYVTQRNIDVWLPEDYSTTKKYAVLYMHDGQMLYDADATWNKQAWEVDEVMAKLLNDNTIQDAIVVGIWNGGTTRHIDYFPQKPFEKFDEKSARFSIQFQ